MLNPEPAGPHEALWHNDGDLIIKVARDGDPPVGLHRVLSGPIKLHSVVVRTMIAKAQADARTQPDLLVYGCPVIQLEDDPGDVTRLLRALYYPGIMQQQRLQQTSFDELEPVLRLACKYQMHDIVNSFLPHLEHDWPSTLFQWDSNELYIQNLYEHYDNTNNIYLDAVTPEPCRVIYLARQCGFYSVLPAAFYHLSRLELDEDDDESVDELPIGAQRATRRYLSPEDWYALYHGIGKIRLWCARLTKSLRRHLGAAQVCCQNSRNPQTCRQSTQALLASIRKDRFGPENGRGLALDPLHMLSKDYVGAQAHPENPAFDLCTACQENVRKWLQRKRSEFWKRLPSFFLLPNWSARVRYSDSLHGSHKVSQYSLIGASVVVALAGCYLADRYILTPPLPNDSIDRVYAGTKEALEKFYFGISEG